MAISREQQRVVRWASERCICWNVPQRFIYSAAQRRLEEENNALLRYFMEVTGYKRWRPDWAHRRCKFLGTMPRRQVKCNSGQSGIMRALSWPISAISEWRQGLNLDRKVNDDTAKVMKPRTVQNIYLGSSRGNKNGVPSWEQKNKVTAARMWHLRRRAGRADSIVCFATLDHRWRALLQARVAEES